MINETETIKVVHKLIPNVPYILIDPANFDADIMTPYQEPEEKEPAKSATTKKAPAESSPAA